MLFDNWRVLHGRTAYTGVRRLCGAYLNHEDFESRLRLAGMR
jgi:trimethyllysine dioxygenase